MFSEYSISFPLRLLLLPVGRIILDAWIGVSEAGEMACVHMPTVCMSYNDQDMQCVSNTPLPYDLFIRHDQRVWHW